MIKRYSMLIEGSKMLADKYVHAVLDENGKYVKYDDIADSLIEWHDLRENPDDLPEYNPEYDNDREVWVQHKETTYDTQYDQQYSAIWVSCVKNNPEEYNAWAEIKPPLTHKEQSK